MAVRCLGFVNLLFVFVFLYVYKILCHLSQVFCAQWAPEWPCYEELNNLCTHSGRKKTVLNETSKNSCLYLCLPVYSLCLLAVEAWS
jgi:hypothetical protein